MDCQMQGDAPLDLMLHWEDGEIIAYPCAGDRVEDQYARRVPWAIKLRITRLTDSAVKLHGARISGTQAIRRRDIIALARRLLKEGITEAYIEREHGRRMPFCTLIAEGVFLGWWYMDVMLVLAGVGSDY